MPGCTSPCLPFPEEQDISRSSIHLWPKSVVLDAVLLFVLLFVLWFLLCSPRMGLGIAGKQSLCLAPLWADFAEASPCLSACLWEAWQGCLYAIT